MRTLLSKLRSINLNNLLKKRFTCLIFLFIFCGGVFSNGLSRIFIFDEIGYYSYLPSLILDRDLDLSNNYEIGRVGYVDWNTFAFEQTNTGAYDNKFSIGPALLWTPFFLLAHFLVTILNFLGALVPADGYGLVYRAFVIFGTQLLSLLSLFLLARLGDKHFRKSASTFGVIVIFSGSFWAYYVYSSPLFSHALSISAAVVFLWAWDRQNSDQNNPPIGLLAAASAFMILIRWQNLVFVAVAFLYRLVQIFLLYRKEKSREAILPFLKQMLLWVGVTAAGVLPQMTIWYFQNGSFFVVPQGPDFLHWTQPKLFELLFSSWHGLISSHPLLLLGLAGFLFMGKERRHLSILFFISFIFLSYVNAIVDDWWAGISFGMRRFDAFIPFFGLGLMQIWKLAGKRLPKNLLLVFSSLFILLNLFLTRLMIDELYHPGYPLSQQWSVFKTILQEFSARPAYLFSHSSPWGVLLSILGPGETSLTGTITLLIYAGVLALIWLFNHKTHFKPWFSREKLNKIYLPAAYLAILLFGSLYIFWAGKQTDFLTLKQLSLGRSVYTSGNTRAARRLYDQIAANENCEVMYLGYNLALATDDQELLKQVLPEMDTYCGPGGWLRILDVPESEDFNTHKTSAEEKLLAYSDWHPNSSYITVLLVKLKQKKGDLSGSAEMLEEVLLTDPLNTEAAIVLSSIYQSQGEWEKALLVLENNPGYAGTYTRARQAEILFAQAKNEELEEVMAEALKSTSGDALESSALAAAASLMQDTDSLRYYSSEITGNRPPMSLGHWYPKIGINSGQAWLGLSVANPQAKQASCIAALEAFSYAVDNYQEFTELSLASNNLSLAEEALNNHLVSSPVIPLKDIQNYSMTNWHIETTIVALENLFNLRQAALSNRLSLGRFLVDEGFHAEALDVLLPLSEYYHPRSGLDPLPDILTIKNLAEETAGHKMSQINFYLGVFADMRFDYEQLSDGFGISEERQTADILFLKGIIKEQKSYVFWWTPKDISRAYLGQAESYFCLEMPREAKDALSSADFRNQKDVNINILLANLEASADRAAAETLYIEALKREPGNYNLLLEYAKFKTRAADFSTAEKTLIEAINLSPGYAAAYQELANTLLKHGEKTEALRLFYQARQLEPGWYKLYGVYQGAGFGFPSGK